MHTAPKGYMGNILRVNLTTGTSTVESLPGELVKNFIGGRGAAAKILYDFGVKNEEQTIAVRTSEVKYIYNNWNQSEDIFFNLKKDPQEKRPMKVLAGNKGKELKNFYREWHNHYKRGEISHRTALDKETEEALKSLGYLK